MADPPTLANSRAGLLPRWFRAGSRSRRCLLAVALYLVCTSIYALLAGPERLMQHTAYNHYALLADAWLHGRQDIAGGPPPESGNNDFVAYHGKTYISFPPLPAILMLPFVKLAGGAENFRDGQFVVWLAGLAPALLFLALEKLRRTRRSSRTEGQNLVFAGLFAFGSVYFFTAVEGTVWFAAMVTAAAASALYTLYALDAESPFICGAMIGCTYLSRPPAIWIALLFALEALRVSCKGGLPDAGRWPERLKQIFERLDVRALLRRYAMFSAPIILVLAFVAWTNWSRYATLTPIYFDHKFLTVAWHARMLRWGMFSYHYLAKNLGVALTSLPWLPPSHGGGLVDTPFRINEHGLALWFTTPLYLWLLWPKRFDGEPDRKWLYVVLVLSVIPPALMNLLYQNSGWRQFGYRFSNDYSVLLFVLLALGSRPMRRLFYAAAAWSVAWNAFGAATFDKAKFDRFYFRDGSQTIVYQPD